jgi:probable H4MPT-linked C1 transfer pathway protein
VHRVLGLDIGGANLKAAHGDGTAGTVPFALWKQPDKLAVALADLMRSLPAWDELAVTMTGELCDCFPTRRQGVLAILDAVETVAAGRPARIWLTTGRLVKLGEARQRPLDAAAANWLALATFAGRLVPRGSGLLVDIGSTTADLIPLVDGRPAARGQDDRERLRSRELVYTGVRRTPVCALLREGVAAELFATTLDVYLRLGQIAEDNRTDTADGRPATRALAHARLARMLGSDGESCAPSLTRRLARRAARAQERLLCRAFRRVTATLAEKPQTVVLAGTGEFLARTVLRQAGSTATMISLAEKFGPNLSAAACAHAVAALATDDSHG